MRLQQLDKNKDSWALYNGDEFVCSGTLKECEREKDVWEGFLSVKRASGF